VGKALKPSRRIALLSHFLHFDLSSAGACRAREELRRAEAWAELADDAMRHLVAPLLFLPGMKSGLLKDAPPDFVEFLELTHRLNAERNDRLRDQAITFSNAMESQGVRVVALKGAAIAFAGAPIPGGGPLMSDLDFLVSSGERDKAIGIAASLNYGVSRFDPDGHSTVLRHPENIASIDLHHDVGPQRDLVPAEEAIRHAERPSGAALWRLAPSDQAIHNVYHSQIQNRCHELAILPLHQLCNFGLLLNRCEERLDWDLVRIRFERAGYRPQLFSYLHLAERLLGIRLPSAIAFGWPERLHFRRMMLQLDWPWLQDLVTYPAILTGQATKTRIAYRRARGAPVQRPAITVAMTVLRGLRRHRGASLSKFMAVHRRKFGRR
jgi:hypothetical protein